MFFLTNSLIISGAAVTSTLVVCVPMAYGLSKIPGRAKTVVSFGVLAMRFVPYVVLALPLILLFVDIGLSTRFPARASCHPHSVRHPDARRLLRLGSRRARGGRHHRWRLPKTLSGVHQPTSGEIRFEGKPVRFANARAAIDAGIATVYQDLAMVPLMSVTRNFWMGRELERRVGPFKWFDAERASRVTMEEMARMGINLRAPDQAVGTLSCGERQTVAIARAVYFGARVLILDEPTSALGVRQTANVLNTIATVRKKGIGVVVITHNVRHAMAVGDRFTVLNRGRTLGCRATLGTAVRGEVTVEELQDMMAGGQEMVELEGSLGGTV